MSLDDLDTGPPRDGWGRYLLPPPEDPDAKPVAWTRATTVAKAPEDQGGLIKWGQRMVVAGLGKRPDLVALAASTDPEDKRALGKIAKDAEEAGGAATGRNTGTAIHSAIEAVNRGNEPLPLFDAEVKAYRAALAKAGLEPVPEFVERIVVNAEHRIAGTFDVALRDKSSGDLYVADLKTGSVDYPASFAIQLAIYATADHLVCPDYKHFEEVPGWSHDRGVIIHLPQGGPCELHWIDLEQGRKGLEVALSVREWRSTAKAKTLLSTIAAADRPQPDPSEAGVEVTVEDTTTIGGPSPDPDRLEWFSARYDEVRESAGPAAIKAAWPEGLSSPAHRDEWTAEELDRACGVIQKLHHRQGLDFAPQDPQAAKLRRKPRTTETKASDDEHAETIAAYKALPQERQDRVLGWQAQGNRVGRSWEAPSSGATRWAITVNRAAIGLAAHTNDDDIARAWISLVIGDDDAQTFPPGALLGSLTVTEAQQLAELTQLDTFAAAIAQVDAA